MKKRIIEEKGLAFGIRISNMVKCLQSRGANRDYLHQIGRSGTSIGANIAEGTFAQSTSDYISKHSIALKEANETKFWLTILYEQNNITELEYSSMTSDLTEIIKILVTIIKKAKGI